MKQLSDFLDEAKAITGSDGKTGKALGVSRQAVSNYRNKQTMSVENAAKLADLLGADFKEVIACCEVGKHPEKADFWGKWIAAGVAFFAAAILKYPAITTGYEVLCTPYYILCKIRILCSRLCTTGRYMVPCS